MAKSRIHKVSGNRIRFIENEFAIVVEDLDCQLSRVYRVGQHGELSMGDKSVMIKSHQEVKDAWKSNRVWF